MMKPINVTIPEQMLAQLNAQKKDSGLTLSELIRRALDYYFNNGVRPLSADQKEHNDAK